jgi:hypothetical protein
MNTVKIQGLTVEFEGSPEAAIEMLRSLGHVFARELPARVAASPALPAPAEEAPALPKLTRSPKAPVKPAVPAKRAQRQTVEEDNDGDRLAARGSALQDEIEDYVRLNGPTSIPFLAVALKRGGAAIGRSVTCSPAVKKLSDGRVYAVSKEARG